MNLKQTLLLAGALCATAQFTQATSVTPSYNLGDLIRTGNSITWGDKTFDDFNLTSAQFGPQFNPNDVTVTPSNIGNTYYLTFGGPFVVMNGALADVQLFYSVSASGGLINMIDQSYTLSVGGTAGSILIGETVRVGGFHNGTTVAQSSLSFVPGATTQDLEDPTPEPLQGDNLWVNPAQQKLWVTKDIFFASNAGGIIGPTIITQSFHQVVPDGGVTAMLLGVGMLGLASVRRKIA